MTTREAPSKRKALENLNSSSKKSSSKKQSGVAQRAKRSAQNVDYDESKMYADKEDFGGVMKVVREKEVVGEDEALVETAVVKAGGAVETSGAMQVRVVYVFIWLKVIGSGWKWFEVVGSVGMPANRVCAQAVGLMILCSSTIQTVASYS